MGKKEEKRDKGWLRGEIQWLDTIRIETVGVGVTSYVPKKDVLDLIERLEEVEAYADIDHGYLNYMNNLGFFLDDALFDNEELKKDSLVPSFVKEYIMWAQEIGINLEESLKFRLHGFSDDMSPEQVLDVSAYVLNEENKKDYINYWEYQYNK